MRVCLSRPYACLTSAGGGGGGGEAGANNEVVRFNTWQRYEFWDLSGKISQRALVSESDARAAAVDAIGRPVQWRRYYQQIAFDKVIYVIHGIKWVSAPAAKRDGIFDEGAALLRSRHQHRCGSQIAWSSLH